MEGIGAEGREEDLLHPESVRRTENRANIEGRAEILEVDPQARNDQPRSRIGQAGGGIDEVPVSGRLASRREQSVPQRVEGAQGPGSPAFELEGLDQVGGCFPDRFGEVELAAEKSPYAEGASGGRGFELRPPFRHELALDFAEGEGGLPHPVPRGQLRELADGDQLKGRFHEIENVVHGGGSGQVIHEVQLPRVPGGFDQPVQDEVEVLEPRGHLEEP
jgi:hypothetical protein